VYLRFKRVSVATVALVAIVTIAVTFRPDASRFSETQCECRMKQIGLALLLYHDTHSVFPASRDAGHSWRIRVLPYMTYSPQYVAYDFDQSWDAENNITVDTRPLPDKHGDLVAFGNPYGPPCDVDVQHLTCYLAICGENAFLGPTLKRRMAEISDGIENTIAAAEVAQSNVHWLSPVDLDLEEMSFVINNGPQSISSSHPSGPAVCFCDGTVFRINPAIDPKIVRGLCTINGGEQISRDALIEEGLLIP